MSSEPTLSINVYNKPEILENSDADAVRVYYIVMGRRDGHLSKDICFNLRSYRFSEIISSRIEIENKLRIVMDRMAPDIYLDELSVLQESERSLKLIIKIIKNNEQRKEIFFNVRKSENEKILVDLLN